jgi:hypothetical protein
LFCYGLCYNFKAFNNVNDICNINNRRRLKTSTILLLLLHWLNTVGIIANTTELSVIQLILNIRFFKNISGNRYKGVKRNG